jgi:hypothetical protein
MARQEDLFGWKRRLAHVIDMGDHGCVYQSGKHLVALFQCVHCGWESKWLEMANVTECFRGVACEPCNLHLEQSRN